MKIAELLRQLADKLDKIENPQDAVTNEPTQEPTSQVMVSPLQAKLELLKKGVGVESNI